MENINSWYSHPYLKYLREELYSAQKASVVSFHADYAHWCQLEAFNLIDIVHYFIERGSCDFDNVLETWISNYAVDFSEDEIDEAILNTYLEDCHISHEIKSYGDLKIMYLLALEHAYHLIAEDCKEPLQAYINAAIEAKQAADKADRADKTVNEAIDEALTRLLDRQSDNTQVNTQIKREHCAPFFKNCKNEVIS